MRRLALASLLLLAGCPSAPEPPVPVVPLPAAAAPSSTSLVDAAPPVSSAPSASASAVATAPPAPAFPPLPEGAITVVFRDLLVGALPYPSLRATWTLATTDDRVVLRLVEEKARASFEHLDATTESANGWRDAVLTAWAGDRPAAKTLGTFELHRVYGPAHTAPTDPRRPRAELPETLKLSCAPRALRVHPVGAALRPGKKRDDDTMTRATWQPAGTESVGGALVCTVAPSVLHGFTEALAFVSARSAGPKPHGGVEWAFDNSDMVIQEGGYRFLPAP